MNTPKIIFITDSDFSELEGKEFEVEIEFQGEEEFQKFLKELESAGIVIVATQEEDNDRSSSF